MEHLVEEYLSSNKIVHLHNQGGALTPAFTLSLDEGTALLDVVEKLSQYTREEWGEVPLSRRLEVPEAIVKRLAAYGLVSALVVAAGGVWYLFTGMDLLTMPKTLVNVPAGDGVTGVWLIDLANASRQGTLAEVMGGFRAYVSKYPGIIAMPRCYRSYGGTKHA